MRVLSRLTSRPAMDGDGVKIRRVADFLNTKLDPYLMLDEIKSNDEQEFIGGFPPHPHRGIETFTYIRKGGFEHRDHLGNVKAIRGGDVQWMSTGSGVLHSEMPLSDANEGLHGFQLWLNMPARDKMRPARYRDSSDSYNPEVSNDDGATLRALAGNWRLEGTEKIGAPIDGLAGNGAIADLMLASGGAAKLDLSQYGFAALYVYEGSVCEGKELAGSVIPVADKAPHAAGELLVLDSKQPIELVASLDGAGMLLLAGNPIGEKIVHSGPFVMNTEAQIRQAIEDYQQGRFGRIA
jgi:quercetin 2,3-dioxygenase